MKTINIYVCGPTLYDDIHIGNARSLVYYDAYTKWLKNKGFNVRYARNVTDFDDKIFVKSGMDNPKEWVTKNTYPQFVKDQEKLGINPPDFEPFASDYIEKIIDFIAACGYVKQDDGLYFEPDIGYGELSGRTTKTPFAVWKFRDRDKEFGWDSHFGYGIPGWHTECAVMIKDIFNGPVDVHGGGVDLLFPHHENENAQFRKVCGCGIAHHWLRCGAVTNNGKKMAKSLGNSFKVKDLDFSTETLRYFLLKTQISKPLNFSFEALLQCEKVVNKAPWKGLTTEFPSGNVFEPEKWLNYKVFS